MLRFLRQIRKRLMEQNNVRTYIFYAIGEILLVVIGILIALQVNNWNEDRKEINEIQTIKENLHDEFQANRTVLEDRIELLSTAIEHAQSVIGYMGSNQQDLESVNMDSILVYSLYYGNFNPSNSSIVDLLQSGKLKLISDKKLKSQLTDWLQLLEDTDEDFKNQDQLMTQYVQPYLREHISVRNIDEEGIYGLTGGRSNLIDNNYEMILNDYQFENLVVDQILWHTIMLRHYQDLDNLAADILLQLKSD